MKCFNCKKEYDIGLDHRIYGYSYHHFCCVDCANKYAKRKKMDCYKGCNKKFSQKD